MYCVVTAGPTYEPLDEVRRLTNFSTGRLGSELAAYLRSHGHGVTLLLGQQATYQPGEGAEFLEVFTTTEDLRTRLQRLASQPEPVDAVFHAAAVGDFKFGKVWQRSPDGALVELKAGKISSRLESMLVELVAAPKIIRELRGWFPRSLLVGWKYEVDDGRSVVIGKAEAQIAENRIDACVANGPAYGPGFGLVTSGHAAAHLENAPALFGALEKLSGGSGGRSR